MAVRFAAVLAGIVVLVLGCDARLALPASPGPSIDCGNPPDLRPVPTDAVELPPGHIAVGYREWHVASRLCNREVVVGGGTPIVFDDAPVPWIANASVPPGTTARTRQRLIVTRLTESGEVTIRETDYGNASGDPYGNLDPRRRWQLGTYRLRIVVETHVIAEGSFVVAGGPQSPASIAP